MAIPIQNDPDSSKQDNDIDTAEIKDNCKGKTNFIVILPKIQNEILIRSAIANIQYYSTTFEGCIQKMKSTRCIKLILRVVPLLKALWMYVDMGLDVNQSISYYQDTFNENGSYQVWALKHRNKTHSDYLQSVAPAYFYVAASVWAGPPVLGVMYVYLGPGRKDTVKSLVSFLNCCFRMNIKNPRGFGLEVLLFVIFMPIFILAMVFFCYIYVPILTLVHAVRKLWQGDDLDEDKKVLGDSYKHAPGFKLFESAGEAVPQLILAVVYAANNYPYLLAYEDYLGIGIPVTIIPGIFSAGSVVMGVISGGKAISWKL